MVQNNQKSNNKYVILAGLFIVMAVSAMALVKAPTDLRVEGLINPIAIDCAIPAFSWKMDDDRRGASQSAWQILVASSQELLVAGKADMWDSGKVKSDQSIYVGYKGKPLSSGQQIVWMVRLWDQDGKVSAFSEPAMFQMALLDTEKEWTSKWIRASGNQSVSCDLTELWMRMAAVPHPRQDINEYTRKLMNMLEPAPLLRCEFTLPSKPLHAVLRSCNLGYGENRINGQKVGDGFFEPALSHYTQRAFYNTYDVTAMLKQGPNALGIILGDGWYFEPMAWAGQNVQVYGHPVATAQLVVKMENGKTVTIGTDSSWKSAPGPILKNHYYIGECYDANALPNGWDLPGFDDFQWNGVDELKEPPTRQLQAQKIESEKIVRRIKPVSVNNPSPGIFVFDMGELLVGFPEIHVPAGQKDPLVLRFSEWDVDLSQVDLLKQVSLLHYDSIEEPRKIPGMIAPKPRGGGFLKHYLTTADGTFIHHWHLATPTSVFQGDGKMATWHPRFAIFPFRYIEVQGLKTRPDPDFLEGLVVHTAMKSTGNFTSSEKIYEDIYQAALNSSLYTFHSMIWDNPCERAQQPMMHSEVFPLVAMSYNTHAAAEKLTEDFEYLRGKRDGFPIHIPYTMRGVSMMGLSRATGGVKQASADINIPWQDYLYYGDKRVLSRHFPYIELFINHFFGPDNPYKKEKYKWLRGGGYTLHISGSMAYPDRATPVEDPSSWDAFAYHSTWMYDLVRKAAKIAEILDRPEKAREYNRIAENIRAEFIQTFPTTKNKGYGGLKMGDDIDFSLGNMIGNAYAVSFGVVPDNDRAAVIANNARIVRERYKGDIVCDPQSIGRNLRILSDNGDVDLAADWMKKTTHPGYGYMLSFGFKTIWEGFTKVEAPNNINSIVQNEFQTGANWFQETLCGVRTDPDSPGMKHFFIEPKIPRHVTSAGMETESPYGTIKSSWTQANGVVTWDVCVPPNSTATAVFPDGVSILTVTESGISLRRKAGVSPYGKSAAKLQSGSYQFSFPAGLKPATQKLSDPAHK